MNALHVVILAAGLGKRMYSDTPKVLHTLAGKALLRWVYETAATLNPQTIHVIYGHGKEQVQTACEDLQIQWVHQAEQRGTGHALQLAMTGIPDSAKVLVLSADVPLIKQATLKNLLAIADHKLALLTAIVQDPKDLGRIIRDADGNIKSIVEEKDASEAEKTIHEIYSGVCVAQASDLKRWLPALQPNNNQQELYLTDIIAMAVKEGQQLPSILAPHHFEIQGVNNRFQLHALERLWQQLQAEQYLHAGVQIADATRFDLRGELCCGKDVFIDINCVFIGQVEIGDHCTIGPHCILSNVTIAAGTQILPYSIIENSTIGKDCIIGPFARLRPETHLEANCKIGNFVETKKAKFGAGSKANHLTYLGDVSIGSGVNIGAGTITCNYDGVHKYNTVIEDGVFIGSGTQLVAPIRVGKNATIGAGALLRKDAPAEGLTVSESKQRLIEGWKRPQKKP